MVCLEFQPVQSDRSITSTDDVNTWFDLLLVIVLEMVCCQHTIMASSKVCSLGTLSSNHTLSSSMYDSRNFLPLARFCSALLSSVRARRTSPLMTVSTKHTSTQAHQSANGFAPTESATVSAINIPEGARKFFSGNTRAGHSRRKNKKPPTAVYPLPANFFSASSYRWNKYKRNCLHIGNDNDDNDDDGNNKRLSVSCCKCQTLCCTAGTWEHSRLR
jgi:hypothetical protein